MIMKIKRFNEKVNEDNNLDIRNLTENQIRKLFNLSDKSSVKILRGDITDGKLYTKYVKYAVLYLDYPVDVNRSKIIKFARTFKSDKLYSVAYPNFGHGATWIVKW